MGNKQSSTAVSPESSTERLLQSQNNNYSHVNQITVRYSSYGALASSPPSFNVTAGPPLPCNGHSYAKKSSPQLCDIVDRYKKRTGDAINFFYHLQSCISELGVVADTTIKDIADSLELKAYKDTEEKVEFFLNSRTAFTKELIDQLSDVRNLHLSMLDELEQHNKELEAKQEDFKKLRDSYKTIYKLGLLILSVCSSLLISLAAPPLATAAISATVAVLNVGDQTFELWANSHEANMRRDIEKARKFITAANLDVYIEIYELQIVRNDLKMLVLDVLSVLEKSETGELKVSLVDSLRHLKAYAIENSRYRLRTSLMQFESKVDKVIRYLERSKLEIQKDSDAAKVTKCIPGCFSRKFIRS